MIGEEQKIEIPVKDLKGLGVSQRSGGLVYAPTTLTVLHYQRRADGSWNTRIDLEHGPQTLDKDEAIRLAAALLKAAQEWDKIEDGAGKRQEIMLIEDIDHDKDTIQIWLEGDKDSEMGWTCDLKHLVTGHFAYRLTQHKGTQRKYSMGAHGAYMDQIDAIQAAILELNEYRRP